MAQLAVVAVLFTACTSGGSTIAPLVTPTQADATPPAVTAPADATAPAVVGAPAAPTGFTATRKSGSAPCPSSAESCSETDLAWQSSADAGTWFRVYSANTGEDPAASCLTVQAQTAVKTDTKPAARTAQIFDPMATGGGETCWWITAVNGAGESTQVPAAGQ